jgi:hypothetical protein
MSAVLANRLRRRFFSLAALKRKVKERLASIDTNDERGNQK